MLPNKRILSIKIAEMTPEEFFELDEMEQAETVWEGIMIGTRSDKEHSILLYKIDNLYVEVFYHKQYNVIRKFEAFSATELLDIYLPKN